MIAAFSQLDITALKLGINWLGALLPYHRSLVVFFSSFYYQTLLLVDIFFFDSIDGFVCLDLTITPIELLVTVLTGGGGVWFPQVGSYRCRSV